MNVPFTDTWRMGFFFKELFSGELDVGDLWDEHSEHRPFVPRIFLLLMGPLADFNMMTIMYATQLCLLATFAGVLLAYRDTVGLDTKSLFFAIPVSLLVFSLSQYWNMLHAWSIHVVVVNFFGVLVFLLLNKLRNKNPLMVLLLFLVAVLCGSVATLSAGHGLLIWSVGLVQLFLEPIYRKSKVYLLSIWALVGAIHWIVYFRNFQAPDDRSSEVYFFNSPTLGVDYFLGLVGFSLFLDSSLAIVAGAVVGVLFVLVILWIVKRREEQRYVFWISLSLFSLLILAATTYGRAGKGLDGSVHSKYVTFSILLFISVYVVLLGLARDHGWSGLSALLVGVCIGLVVLSAPLSYYSAVQRAESIEAERKEKACVLLDYEDRSDIALQQTFRPLKPPVEGRALRDSAALFDERNYTTFALSATQIQSELGCKP